MTSKSGNIALVIILVIIAALILNSLGIIDLSNIFAITLDEQIPYLGFNSTPGSPGGAP